MYRVFFIIVGNGLSDGAVWDFMSNSLSEGQGVSAEICTFHETRMLAIIRQCFYSFTLLQLLSLNHQLTKLRGQLGFHFLFQFYFQSF